MILYYESVDEETEQCFECFEFEVQRDELQTAMLDILYDEYFSDIKESKKQIKDSLMDLFNGLDIDLTDIADDYRDELTEYFEEEAWDEYRYN